MSGRIDTYKDTTQPKDELVSYLFMHYEQIHAVLKALGKSNDEIEKTLDRVKEAKHRIEKLVKKFRRKVDRKYGLLSEADLIKKAVGYAAKGKLSDTERDVFIKHVLHGNDALYYHGEHKYSKMSQFLGYDTSSPMLNVQAKDQASLNELVSLFNLSKSLYYDIRQQSLHYEDCAAQAISGKYNPEKHRITQHIHPIVAMLFLPDVDSVTNKMLKPNIGRMVLARAPLIASKVNLYESVMPGDIESEFDLGYAMSKDPNSTNVFSDETPIENLTRRFQCQIELWNNVLNLRSGRYYSSTMSYDTRSDGIAGFMKALDGYNKIQYDVVDNFNTQDEGNILKKLLGVFSIRPTYAQIYTAPSKLQIGYGNISGAVERVTFINMPVVNIRLPSNMVNGVVTPGTIVHLRHALNQSDIFLKNRQLVPMNKSIIMSDRMIFFYAHRRQRTVNTVNMSVGFRNIALTPSFIGTTILNRTPLAFNMTETIGRENFKIRGIIVHETPVGTDIITGCSAYIVMPADLARGHMRDQYLSYNPVAAGIQFRDPTGTGFTRNEPICSIPERGNATGPGFRTNGSTHGCIFWYVNPRPVVMPTYP
jgi:hypothetical protein